MTKLQIAFINIILCLLLIFSFNLYSQDTILYDIDTIRTKHYYRNVLTKEELHLKYSLDSFSITTRIKLDNETKAKYITNYCLINDTSLTVWFNHKIKDSWTVKQIDDKYILKHLNKTAIASNLYNFIKHYEYNDYKNNRIANTLKTYYNRKVCKPFGTIYETINDSTLKTSSLSDIQVWKYKRTNLSSDSVYYISRLTKNLLTEIGYAKTLIPLEKTGHTIRYRDSIIVENIYKPSCEIYENETDESETIFNVVEVMPEFIGGKIELLKNIRKNIEYYPQTYSSSIQGKVYVKFVVTKNGIVKCVHIIRGIGKYWDEESFIAVSKLSRFKPGLQRGEAVNVWFIVPVNFQLD